MRLSRCLLITVLTALAMPEAAQACADRAIAFPAQRVEPAGDGEDEEIVAYYAFEGMNFELVGDRGELDVAPYTKLRVYPPGGDGPPDTIAAPDDRRYDPDGVYVADDGSVAAITLVGAPRRVLLVELASARVLADLGADAVAIESDRVRVAGIGAELCARLATIVARPAWQRVAWDAHQESIQLAREIAIELLDRMQGQYVNAKAREELKALLGASAQAIEAHALAGRWRVRSLQASAEALFAYPYFNAEFQVDGDTLLFRKTSGSQRRSGRLYPYGDDRSWVFVGTATVNDEPEKTYSRLDARPLPEPFDSVGRLWILSADHAYFILDAEHGLHFEVYELRRPRT